MLSRGLSRISSRSQAALRESDRRNEVSSKKIETLTATSQAEIAKVWSLSHDCRACSTSRALLRAVLQLSESLGEAQRQMANTQRRLQETQAALKAEKQQRREEGAELKAQFAELHEQKTKVD